MELPTSQINAIKCQMWESRLDSRHARPPAQVKCSAVAGRAGLWSIKVTCGNPPGKEDPCRDLPKTEEFGTKDLFLPTGVMVLPFRD